MKVRLAATYPDAFLDGRMMRCYLRHRVRVRRRAGCRCPRARHITVLAEGWPPETAPRPTKTTCGGGGIRIAGPHVHSLDWLLDCV
uniref:Uncharacterized protein n=1 Tax=Setaria italica TaxID=4555 RepID=K4AJS1_SETIT